MPAPPPTSKAAQGSYTLHPAHIDTWVAKCMVVALHKVVAKYKEVAK